MLCQAELQPQEDAGVYQTSVLADTSENSIPRGIRPQSLEVVEVTGLAVEQMHDQVSVVEEHPPAVVGAFSSERTVAHLAEPQLDVVCEGADVTVRCTRTDHEDIGDHNKI